MNQLPIFYNEAEEWSRTLLLYDAALKVLNIKLETWNNEFKLTHQYNPIEHITSRIKSPQSIAKKMKKYGEDLTIHNIVDMVNDLAGIRIICSFTEDIYRIAELISSQSDVKVITVKDYIRYPKPNGYTSFHMIVSVPVSLSQETVDTKVEIQIRTIAMDFWASLEHKIYYKFEGKAPSHIQRELKECADLVSFLDKKMLSINSEIQQLQKQESFSEEDEESVVVVKSKSFTEDSLKVIDSEEDELSELKASMREQTNDDRVPFPEKAFKFPSKKKKGAMA